MIATLSKKLFERLKRKSYRDEYVAEGVRTGIAHQIRALRDQREWSQKMLADVLVKPQSVVSRIEDPDYGKLSIQTLLEIAAAFDVGLIVRFVNFPEFLRRTRNVGPQALTAESFDEAQFRSVDGPRDSWIVTRPDASTLIVLRDEPEPSFPVAFVATTARPVSALVH
jgi:transcriptional regulator with XRE-family HTH domain